MLWSDDLKKYKTIQKPDNSIIQQCMCLSAGVCISVILLSLCHSQCNLPHETIACLHAQYQTETIPNLMLTLSNLCEPLSHCIYKHKI